MTTTETMDCSPFKNGSFTTSHSSPSSRTFSGVTPPKCKPMKRKPNPNNHASVFKSSAIAPCSECGKQFNSWKALFGHMRCHPDRPYRGMIMKHKQKAKVHMRPRSSNWDHITDEVMRAALILMEMSGQSVEHIVNCMKSSCKGGVEIGKARIGCNSPLMDAEKEIAKLEKPFHDLNLAALLQFHTDEECVVSSSTLMWIYV